LRNWPAARKLSKGIFDIAAKQSRLSELSTIAAAEDFWNQPLSERTAILKETSVLEGFIQDWTHLCADMDELDSGLLLLAEESDEELLAEQEALAEKVEKEVGSLELKNLLGGESDANDAIMLVHSGAGGTEANDWAAMLHRMYLRWAEEHDYKVEELDFQAGEEAGIKSALFSISGAFAFGNLKTEVGVHRLVRISPFDANKRRHTSFASVFVYPDIDDSIEVEINEGDLEIDTYRAQGAGGQHINTTDSAVRITHVPTGIVVQCQSERSQHKNKASAMRVLRARLYEKEREEREAEKDRLNAQKRQISWGSQIRSYVLHPYQMVKDHRTDTEVSAASRVLDGDIDLFIEQALLQKVV